MARPRVHAPSYELTTHGTTFRIRPVHRLEYAPRPWSCDVLIDGRVIWTTDDSERVDQAQDRARFFCRAYALDNAAQSDRRPR
jgi:hypothetical protein